jgi:hypothetical protein
MTSLLVSKNFNLGFRRKFVACIIFDPRCAQGFSSLRGFSSKIYFVVIRGISWNFVELRGF